MFGNTKTAGLCLQTTCAWPQRPGAVIAAAAIAAVAAVAAAVATAAAAAAESRPDAAKDVNHISRDQEEEKDYSCEHWEDH